MSENNEMPAVTANAEPINQSSTTNTPNPSKKERRGGFMGGGLATTFLFLLAFFMVSYSLGVATERNNKLMTGGAATGVGTAAASTFNAAGFKKLAADLKLDTKKFNSCLDESKTADAVKKDLNESVALGVQGTPSFVINGMVLVGAQPYDNFVKVIEGQVKTTEEIYKMVNGPTASSVPDLKAQPGIQDGEKVDIKINIDEARTAGDKNAPVTMYEFSDFECPFCGSFYRDTYKQLTENYVKKGKLRIVFVDHPLSFHPQAQKAAEAARCAQEQGKFWEMHDGLFDLQLSNAK
jgi:protein-disulfide isomerase